MDPFGLFILVTGLLAYGLVFLLKTKYKERSRVEHMEFGKIIFLFGGFLSILILIGSWNEIFILFGFTFILLGFLVSVISFLKD